MRTETITLYTFEELPEEAQQKAIENNYDINVNREWWEFDYEDAEQVGIKITGFDIGRSNCITGELIDGAYETINLILANHGEETETYKTAERYKDLINNPDEDAEYEFLQDILADYLSILRREYEYLTSEEAIRETIIANGYEFTIDGRIEQ